MTTQTTQPSPTSSMNIDIMSYIESDNILKDCEELGEIKAFQEFMRNKNAHKNFYKNRVVAYIVILYSVDTIMDKQRNLPLSERKKKAADLVKLPRNKDGEFTQRVQDDIFNLKGDGVVECVFEFLKHQNNYVWMKICVNEALLDQYTYQIYKAVQMEDAKKETEAIVKKKELRKEINEITQDLKQFYKEFFKEHLDVKEHKHIQKRSIEERARVKS